MIARALQRESNAAVSIVLWPCGMMVVAWFGDQEKPERRTHSRAMSGEELCGINANLSGEFGSDWRRTLSVASLVVRRTDDPIEERAVSESLRCIKLASITSLEDQLSTHLVNEYRFYKVDMVYSLDCRAVVLSVLGEPFAGKKNRLNS